MSSGKRNERRAGQKEGKNQSPSGTVVELAWRFHSSILVQAGNEDIPDRAKGMEPCQ